MLVAFAQYLRWKDTDLKKFRGEHRAGHSASPWCITVLGVIVLRIHACRDCNLIALFFATAFAVVANVALHPDGPEGQAEERRTVRRARRLRAWSCWAR